jgi:enoyl-CoA hydratase/carnithine racemase
VFNGGGDTAAFKREGPEKGLDYLIKLIRILVMILEMPVPTICAINGHTWAGGVIFALACDFRFCED